jgi:hypothetical protein
VNVNEPDNYRQTALHLALDHGTVVAPHEIIAVVASGVQNILRVMSLFLRFSLWISGVFDAKHTQPSLSTSNLFQNLRPEF